MKYSINTARGFKPVQVDLMLESPAEVMEFNARMGLYLSELGHHYRNLPGRMHSVMLAHGMPGSIPTGSVLSGITNMRNQLNSIAGGMYFIERK